MTTCIHVRGIDYVAYEGGGLFTVEPLRSADRYEWFNYCPRCGEKLPGKDVPSNQDGVAK